MKKLVLVISACVLMLLPACGAGPEIDTDLVFVNDSDAVIVEVVVDFEDRSGGSRRADGDPLDRGDTLGFEAGEYPVTVAVYDAVFEGHGQEELASLTIPEAPPEGERWYVTAQDGAEGLTLVAETSSSAGPDSEEG